MCARSASVNAVIARTRRASGAYGAPRLGGASTSFSASRKSATSWNAAVDRREADVGDLVELVELLHHHLADLPRRNLALAQRQHLLRRCGRRPASTYSVGTGRLCSARWKPMRIFVDVEVGAGAVGLHDLRQPQLDGLVGREALLAGDAAAAAADRVARLGHARVDDLRVGAAAERALHGARRIASAVDRKLAGRARATPRARPWRSPRRRAARRARRRSGAPSSSHSISVKPRVVIAGLPMRMPDVTNGFSGSLGIAFLLTVMCARRRAPPRRPCR